MVEVIGEDLKTNNVPVFELRFNNKNILKEKVSKHLFDTLKYKSYVGY